MTDHTPSPQSVVVPVEPLTEMRAAAGYLRNAKIDLETGAPKATAIRTIEGGLKRLEGAIDAFADDGKAIKAAPAPSSLAGGEVHDAISLEVRMAMQDEMMASDANGGRVLQRIERANRAADAILAALFPEAPAREGWEEALIDRLKTLALLLRSEAGEKDGLARQDDLDAAEAANWAVARISTLTLRHEAPASDEMFGVTGAVDEVEALACALFAHLSPGIRMNEDEDLPHYRDAAKAAFDRLRNSEEAPAEGAEDDGVKRIIKELLFREERKIKMLGGIETADLRALVDGSAKHIDALTSALRARSSAPEAREGEAVPFIVGNQYRTQGGDLVRFVSVHRAGTSYETMADEDGVHRYTSRDFGRVTGTDHGYSDPRNTPPLYTHPAAPSADKLRTALSEIRDGMVASRYCISVDDWIELADEALSTPDALKGDN